MKDDTALELAAETLAGDVARFLVDRLRHMECAFRYLNEADQQDVINDARAAARRCGRTRLRRALRSSGTTAFPLAMSHSAVLFTSASDALSVSWGRPRTPVSTGARTGLNERLRNRIALQ